MKRLLVIMTIALCSAGLVRADEGKPMNNQGNMAWLFTFTGLSNFGIGGLFTVNPPALNFGNDFHGTGNGNSPLFFANSSTRVPGVGLRYYLANNMALRGGLGIGILSQSQKNSNSSLSDNTASGMLLGIQAMLEFHMNGLGALSPYLGAGIGFHSGSYTTKTYSSATNSDEMKNSSSLFNILGACGFEWFFANRMSLGAEYQLGIGMASGSMTDSPSGGTSTTTDAPSSTNIGTNAFSVILSMYP